jgi:diketogulonate reductase-like aldo/keto reductase
VPLKETLDVLCKAKRDGRTKHVGVANFTMSLLEEAVKLASEPLVTNQIEVHPFIDQDKVLAACRTLGLSVTAYCPLARGKVPGNDMLARIGKAHGNRHRGSPPRSCGVDREAQARRCAVTTPNRPPRTSSRNRWVRTH